MRQFQLTATYIVEGDLECNVCVRPSDSEISDFISSCRTYASEAIAVSEIPNFISEQTPLMFDVFKNADNIPQALRDEFYL
jgi:hypothetical protein